VRCLLAAGAGVDTPSPINGNTGGIPWRAAVYCTALYCTALHCTAGLHCAVEADQPEMVQLLLEAGADSSCTNRSV
jgi:hypothetical protein